MGQYSAKYRDSFVERYVINHHGAPMPCPLRPRFYLDDAQGDWIIGGTGEAVSLMSSLFRSADGNR
jgi:hypothetical protein